MALNNSYHMHSAKFDNTLIPEESMCVTRVL